MHKKNLIKKIKHIAACILLIKSANAMSRDAYVILIIGQSNAVGRAEVSRLDNKQYNPMGFIANPSRVKIYDKGNFADLDLSKDNGSWKDYYAGVNSNTDGSPLNNFGPELSLSQMITRTRSGNVYIIKAAFGGTALSPGIPTMYPGNWTEKTTYIAMEYYFKPAMRDLHILETNVKVHFIGVIWWQGESDAAYGISASDYKERFLNLKKNVDVYLSHEFNIRYKWALIGLNYNHDDKEKVINSALSSLEKQNCHYISTINYPRKMDLNTSQQWPLSTERDDNHSSYIAQLAVGTKSFEVFFKGLSSVA